MVQIKDNEFKRLVEYVHRNFGIDLGRKRILVEGRLGGIVEEKGYTAFGEYLDEIMSDKDGAEIGRLINHITTNHTFFMRETDHFEYFRTAVLPWLEAKAARESDIRVWSAGCSSGEEPYTLAMLMADHFGDAKGMWDKRILATDISTNVLVKAQSGVYPAEAVNGLPAAWRLNYLEKTADNDFRVCKKIRDEVVFRYFNLMEEIFPFKKKFHVIFCRNVMIYFDNATKMDLINRFYENMENGGYLFIGHSESINRDETDLKYVMPAVYRKQL